jgi:hypothetical protein
MKMQAMISTARTVGKAVWATAAAKQNVGVFHKTEVSRIPMMADGRVSVPKRLDLRASGLGFHNLPVTLGFTENGAAFLQIDNRTVLLGNLAGSEVETGWIVTGLRLRGAVRFSNRVVLIVPDREDIPYLLRVLVAKAKSQNLPGAFEFAAGALAA